MNLIVNWICIKHPKNPLGRKVAEQIYHLLPVVLHYPAVLYSSSGGRQLWIPLAVFEAALHLPLEAIKKATSLSLESGSLYNLPVNTVQYILSVIKRYNEYQ